MNHKSAAQFWFEPRCLGRHNHATVCNGHNLLHGHWIKGKRHFHLPTVATPFQFVQPAQAAHEIDSLVATQILDAQQLIQNQATADADIERVNRVVLVETSRTYFQPIPVLL